MIFPIISIYIYAQYLGSAQILQGNIYNSETNNIINYNNSYRKNNKDIKEGLLNK